MYLLPCSYKYRVKLSISTVSKSTCTNDNCLGCAKAYLPLTAFTLASNTLNAGLDASE